MSVRKLIICDRCGDVYPAQPTPPIDSVSVSWNTYQLWGGHICFKCNEHAKAELNEVLMGWKNKGD